MGIMKKLAIFFVSALAITTVGVVATPAQAAVKCAQATAKAHTPGKVAQPTKAAKPLPKKFTFNTNCGVIEVTLNPKAPITITSLAALIKGKYYDNSLCHRLTTQGLFVLQCGDPTLTGAGSPTGWKGYKDENLPKNVTNNYPAGTVAMANSGPATNGSQVFFVYEDTSLGANYTIWGKITKGLDIVQYVAKQGAISKDASGKLVYSGDGFTAQPVQIISAKVS
ncbi:MAG: peptidylprolyl isomerase [Candidatus Nanopelagicaceae bacterium]|jgi:peptidyl-prolyl cis-trans isomerase B (cyclophilin B)